jgi:hypothetical protein
MAPRNKRLSRDLSPARIRTGWDESLAAAVGSPAVRQASREHGRFLSAISRVLLATIGPYAENPAIAKRTAHVILKDAVYKELKKLPTLHAKNPEKIANFLPSSVAYDAATNTITHTYRGGGKARTNLGALEIPRCRSIQGRKLGIYRLSPWSTSVPTIT